MKNLLFNFEGRIPRSTYWCGMLLLTLFAVVFVFGVVFFFAREEGPFDLRTLIQLNSLTGLGMLYCAASLMTRRVKDRDRPLWLVKLFVAPYGLLLVGEILGITSTQEIVNGVPVRLPTAIGSVLGIANLVVTIWALVELGFKRGTRGPNQWGPDPLSSDSTPLKHD